MAHPNLANVLGKGKLRGNSLPGHKNSPMVKWGWWGLLRDGGTLTQPCRVSPCPRQPNHHLFCKDSPCMGSFLRLTSQLGHQIISALLGTVPQQGQAHFPQRSGKFLSLCWHSLQPKHISCHPAGLGMPWSVYPHHFARAMAYSLAGARKLLGQPALLKTYALGKHSRLGVWCGLMSSEWPSAPSPFWSPEFKDRAHRALVLALSQSCRILLLVSSGRVG